MKLSRIFFRRKLRGHAAVALVFGIGIMVHSAGAQDARSGPKNVPFEYQTLNLDFPGGSPEDLRDVLRAATGRSPNMVVPRDLRRVELPNLQLRNVTVDQIFETLNHLGERHGIWRSLKSGGDSDKVWVLQGRPVKRETRIFQLKPFLDSYTIEDISTAIQSGWELKSELTGELAGEMRFHEDTSLLFVVASSVQLDTVSEILQQLSAPIQEGRALEEALEKQQAQARDHALAMRMEAQAQLADLREHLAINEEKLAYKEKIQHELEARLKESENRLAKLHTEMQQLATEQKLREIDLMSERDRQLQQAERDLKAAQDALQKNRR